MASVYVVECESSESKGISYIGKSPGTGLMCCTKSWYYATRYQTLGGAKRAAKKFTADCNLHAAVMRISGHYLKCTPVEATNECPPVEAEPLGQVEWLLSRGVA